MKKFLSLFLLSVSAFAQQGIFPGTGTGGGVAQTISGLTYSPDDTTIVATWFTSGGSNSVLSCGGKAAVDNNFQQSVTFHQAVVTGLSSSTLYSCAVTSGATTSSSTNVTTLAPVTRTAPTTASTGTATINTTPIGDSFYNATSNDNVTYVTIDDSSGLTPGCSQNMQINKFTTESTMAGSSVNCLTVFGAGGTSNGTDGISGFAASNKLNGIFAMGGDLYAFASRNVYPAVSGNPVQTAWNGYWMKSRDHGATWNVFQNPTSAPSTNGISPSPLGSNMFGTNTLGWCVPTRYALDDGTLGYTATGNRVDGANAFVYGSCTDGEWNNSSHLYMFRIARVQFASQNYGAIQWWIGPSSPTPAQFVTDTNWTSSSASATSIYTAVNQTSAQDMVFLPSFNVYLLLTWYQASPSVTSNSTWVFSTAPTPAGPWTTLLTQTNTPSGFYNPVAQHRTVATISTTSNVAIQLLFSGDYNNTATYYHPTYENLTLNPSSYLLDVIGAGTATFAGSASHLLRSAYAGSAVRIQRASDSTQTDVGFNVNGTINQTTITAFCSGTTCNVAKLYDQSGSGHDAVQATFANMPVIYTGGAVVLDGTNNQVSMLWDGTTRYLASSITFSGTAFESLGILNVNASAIQFSGAIEMTNGTNSGGTCTGCFNMLDYNLSNVVQGNATGTGTAAQRTITAGTQFLEDTEVSPGSPLFLAVNGGAFANTSGSSGGTVAATVLDIGADLPATSFFWFGKISDVVVYSIALSTGQRSTAHTTESTFFGTP